VNQGADLLLSDVREKIEKAIKASASAWKEFVDDNLTPSHLDKLGRPLAMKYVPSKWAKDYLKSPTNGFFIGNKDFTWGKAVYVTGVEEPLSTAIYGRIGLVSFFEPADDWKVFDARDKAKADLYLEWLRLQPSYPEAILTVHTNHWLHGLRNDFREQFEIDVVLCRPDERDQHGWYTDPANDTWACVSDWGIGPALPPNHRWLASGYSDRFPQVRLTIVAEEEFVTPEDPTVVRPPHQPPPRVPQLAVSGNAPGVPVNPDIREAYWLNQIARVQS
jgi:hypothetical protein